MENGFWEKLKRPIMALAPMANVTDAAFRQIIAKYSKYGGHDIGDGSRESLPAEAFRAGGPDVMFTEFTSADGLVSKGKEHLLVDLIYSEGERPIVAQLFSGNPEKMYKAATLVKELKFDGLDINMGCPDRSIERSGAGASLIKNPRVARELIRAARDGSGLPISIKTRLGYQEDSLEEWLPELLAERPAAITVHARTRKEMSKVPARWERIKRAVEIRDECKSGTLILGNGDVMSFADAHQKVRDTRADGIMLGRAIFGSPYLFSNSQEFENRTVKERLEVMVEHSKLFEKLLGEHKNFAIMKKHFKAYVEGFEGAKDLRMKLMETNSAFEVEKVMEDFLYKKDKK